MDFLRRVWRRTTRCFLSGVICILPVVITVAIVVWVAGFIESYLGPGTSVGGWFKGLGVSVKPDSAAPYVIGWIVVLAVVFAVGLVAELGAKSLIRRLMEATFKRVPLLGSIYSTSKQMVEMLDQKEESALQGMSAVFCFFGEGSSGVLAFLVSPDKYQVGDKQYHIVIIPTAPLPFGGALLLVEADKVRPANMPVDGMMNVYLSMGVTAPQYMKVVED